MTTRQVLVRVYRNPFRGLNPVRVLDDNVLSGNTGNLLFSDAAVRALSADDVELTCWTTEQIASRVARVNATFDHVVLPLANAFRPQYLEQLALLTDVISRLEVPVTVLGVGVQASADFELPSDAEVDRAAATFMRAVLERGPSVGVRGAFTAEYLRTLGFGTDEVDVIGCPSMFGEGASVRPPRPLPPGGPTRLSVNLTPTAPVDGAWLDELIDRFPNVLYVPQDRRDLGLMLWQQPAAHVPSQFPGFPDSLSHRLFAEREAHLHLDPRAWLADLAQVDFVIGTRIHGAISGTLAGTPSHLLVHDSRTRELAEHFEIPHTRIDGGRPHPEIDDLLDADYGAPARGHGPRFGRFTRFLDGHGLPHVWREGAASTWEDRIGEPVPPVAVDHGQGPSAARVIRWVEERRSTQVATLTLRVRQHESEVRELRDENKDLRRLAKRLERRLDGLERRGDEPIPEPGASADLPPRRVLGRRRRGPDR